MKKITDYNAQLDLHFESMLKSSKIYVVLQEVLFVVMLFYYSCFFQFDKSGISSICIPLSFISFVFIHVKIQTIICLYLRDRNTYIYDKYKTYWSYVRGYYPLSNINLFRLTKNDLSEIKDERIVILIQAKRKAFLICISCVVILLFLLIGKSFRFL